jgi:hypothetical protein
MEKNKQTDKEFHAVEFMREVRSQLTEEFLNDKQKYVQDLRKAVEKFKLQQKLTRV